MAGTPIAINTRSSAAFSAGQLVNILSAGTFDTFAPEDILQGYAGTVVTGLFNGQNILTNFSSSGSFTYTSQSYKTVYIPNYSPTSQSLFDIIYYDSAGDNSSQQKRAFLSLKSYLPDFDDFGEGHGIALAFHRDLFKDRLSPSNFSASIGGTNFYVNATEPPYKVYYATSGGGRLYPSYGILVADGASGEPTLIKAQSKEVSKSYIYFARIKNSKFNHSNNKTYSELDANTGEYRIDSDIRYADNNLPITYITTIGLYNNENELLAVGKLSNPVFKSYSNELLIKVKVDF